MKAVSIFFTLFLVINAQAEIYGGNINLSSGVASMSYKNLKGDSSTLLTGTATIEIIKKFGAGKRIVIITDSSANRLEFVMKSSYFKNDLDLNSNEENLQVKTSVVTLNLNEKYERPGFIEESYDCSTYSTDSDGNVTTVSQTCSTRYHSIDIAQDYDTQTKINVVINGQPLEFVHSQTTTKIFSQRKKW